MKFVKLIFNDWFFIRFIVAQRTSKVLSQNRNILFESVKNFKATLPTIDY